MSNIDSTPLIQQLKSVDASYEHLAQQIRAAEGKTAALPSEEFRELMDEIAKARQSYIAELVSLSFTLRVLLEKSKVQEEAI